MKTKIALTAVATAIFICISLVPPIDAEDMSKGTAATASSAAPAAAFPEVKYQFDSVMEGTEVVHDFLVKNNGKGPLDIKKVRTG